MRCTSSLDRYVEPGRYLLHGDVRHTSGPEPQVYIYIYYIHIALLPAYYMVFHILLLLITIAMSSNCDVTIVVIALLVFYALSGGEAEDERECRSGHALIRCSSTRAKWNSQRTSSKSYENS